MKGGKKIAFTTFVRFFGAGVGLLLLLLNAKFLGKAGVGELSLALLAVAFYQNVYGFVTGAIPYWTTRISQANILSVSLIWILISSAIATPIFYGLGMLSSQYFLWIIILAILHGIHGLLQNLLIGNNAIKQFNLVLLISHVVVITSVCVGFFIFDWKSILWVLQAMSIGYGIAVLYNLLVYLPSVSWKSKTGDQIATLLQLLRHGTYVQLANLFQQINYRLTYYFVEASAGIEMLGLYAAGIQLSEGIWNLSKSFAVVEYGEIANEKEVAKQIEIRKKFLRISVTGTLILIIILVSIPEFIFTTFLGEDFLGVKNVIFWLAPGVLIYSVFTIYSHYFSGIGRFWENTISSGIAMLVTVLGCVFLIKEYGLIGAAVTQNTAYLITALYLIIIARKGKK